MIGVFDSGLGGLTILKQFIKKLPNYDYIYLGDTARAPYGSKSQEAIYSHTLEAVDFLFNQGCEIIVIACNTASAQALRRIQQEYLPKQKDQYPKRRVLGVIRPLIEKATEDKEAKIIGVLGTNATIKSDVYEIEKNKLKKEKNIIQQAAPLLVPLIEEGWEDKEETESILKEYLEPLKEKKVDSLILACTHYPILMEQIQEIMGNEVKVYNPGEIVAESFKDYLNRHTELGIKETKEPIYKFYTTDDPRKFKELGEKFLDMEMEDVERVELRRE